MGNELNCLSKETSTQTKLIKCSICNKASSCIEDENQYVDLLKKLTEQSEKQIEIISILFDMMRRFYRDATQHN